MPFVFGGVDNLKIKLQIVDKLIILQVIERAKEGDRSLEELQARTALLNIMNIADINMLITYPRKGKPSVCLMKKT